MKTLEGKQIHRLYAFEHGYAVFSIKKGRKILYGIVHSDRRIRVQPIYAFAGIEKINGEWICQFENFNSGWLIALLDDWNDMGIPREQFFSSIDGKGEYFIIKREGGYKGIYRKSPDNIILEPIYRRIFIRGNSVVAKNSKNRWGALSLKGKVIIPFEYDFVSYRDMYYIVEREADNHTKCALMDSKGKLKIPFLYDCIRPINGKYVSVAIFDNEGYSSCWKLLDMKGNEIQPAGKSLEQFDYNDVSISSFNPNKNILDVYLHPHYGGVIGVDDKENTYHFIATLANNHIHSCCDGNFVVYRFDMEKYGLISSKGKGLAPCEYDYMDYGDDSNLIVVNKGEEWFCINSRNERILF